MEELKELIKVANIEKLRDLLSGESRKLLNNRDDEEGFSLLHIAVRCSGKIPEKRGDYLLVARELINFGANVNAVDYNETPPLHFAVRFQDIKMIECLLENKALVNLPDKKRFTALHLAGTIPYNHSSPPSIGVKVVKRLLKHKAILDVRDNEDNTPLITAVRYNHYLIVLELLNNNASPNIGNHIGNTAMHYALTHLNINLYVVQNLFRHGSMFNVANCHGYTPLKCYINKLKTATPIEIIRAKHVFRLFGLMYHLMKPELHVLDSIKLAKDHYLPEFIMECYEELLKMKRDVLEPNFSVFDIAERGVFYIYRKNIYRTTCIEVLKKVLVILMEGQYPLYSVYIVEGIYRPYMKARFAAMCSDETRIPYFLDYSEFTLFSEYLTNSDMLYMMMAVRNASLFSRLLKNYSTS